MTDEHPPVQHTNPYAPSEATPSTQAAEGSVEAVRREYLSHEASIKSIGLLYLIGAVFLIPIGIGVTSVALYSLASATSAIEPIVGVLLGFVYLSTGIMQAVTAIGIRKFRPWARIAAIVFSVIGLIGFPVGTLISGYFLYLLISKKGVYVFSDHYQGVIAATPHIKYKTSIVVWIFLGLLLFIIGLGIIALVVASFSGV